MKPVVLVVEDNPVTRRLLRTTLELEGHQVLEAGTGREALSVLARTRPDAVVQDLILPDMDGEVLLARLRDVPGCSGLPALVMSGLLSRLDELSARNGPSVRALAKPVGPKQLVEELNTLLSDAGTQPRAVGPRVVAAIADPAHRRAVAGHLREAGFDVVLHATGQAAMEEALREPAAAILADLVLPDQDGFDLCSAIRLERRLTGVPVVLLTPHPIDEHERRLSRAVGADALIQHIQDSGAVTTVVRAVVEADAERPRPQGEPDVAEDHRRWLLRQIHRQAATSDDRNRRDALQTSALFFLTAISEGLAKSKDANSVLGDVLVHCLDAAGLSTGLLYLVDRGRLVLRTATGLRPQVRRDAEDFFGHEAWLRSVLEGGAPTVARSESLDPTPGVEALDRMGQRSALLVPFVVGGERFGVIVLASDVQDLAQETWLAFGQSLALQFGQSVALGQSLSQLALSEEQYRLLFDSNPQPMWVFDEETLAFLAVNAAAVRHYGFSREEFRRMTIRDIYPAGEIPRLEAQLVSNTQPADRPEALHTGTWTHLTKGGTPIEVEVVGSPILLRGRRAQLTLATDVTAKKALEAQLVQAQKLEALGRLAGGVAHDFNNILGIITGYAQLLSIQLPEADARHHYVEDIQKAAWRAAGLTRQLLAFSRRHILEPRIVDLREQVREVETMLGRLIGEDVELVVKLGSEATRVKADPGQLEQVVVNLAVNARDAMPQGGRLVIEVSNVHVDEVHGRLLGDAVPGPYVRLTVTDSGHGMTPEVQARIFEPFFTTKEIGRGTGLGLAMVYGFVKQSGGHIKVYSEPEKGTAFKIYLPAVHEAVTALAGSPTQEAPLPRGSETVLIVEDEAVLRSIVKECLVSWGYTVLEASHGAEALRASDQYSGRIDLLITDVVMPGIGGRELAERLTQGRRGLQVLFLSGYTDDTVGRHGLLTDAVAFLQKPFSLEALARMVRGVLEGSPPTTA